MVCTQHMYLHVPVPLSLLPQHLLPPLVVAEVSEAGNTQRTESVSFTLITSFRGLFFNLVSCCGLGEDKSENKQEPQSQREVSS